MAGLLVLAAPPGATLQDRGRYGWLHAGVPASGPLDAAAHAAANLAVGNDPGDVAIEIPLGPLRIKAIGAATVSIDGEQAVLLGDGEEHAVGACQRAVRYLAVAGAFEIERVLGSRSTLLVATLGGFDGRALRAGDELPIGSSSARSLKGPIPTVTDPSDPASFQIMAGPHLARFAPAAFAQLLETTWQISRLADRVGVRLEGAKIARPGSPASDLPAPMVRGAVQITTDGTPIVLGPDHPVTGGYPVLAVVSRASQATLARLRAERRLRFILGPSAGQ